MRVVVLSRVNGLRRAMESLVVPAGVKLSFPSASQTEEVEEHLSQSEVVVCDPDLFARFQKHFHPGVRWVQSTWAGVNVVTHALQEAGHQAHFTLTRLGGCFGAPMTEYVVGQVVARERKFQFLHQAQLDKRFHNSAMGYSYRELSQLRIGIMGMGSIGTHMARVLSQGFGVEVHGLARTPRSEDADTSVASMYYSGQKSGLEDFLGSGLDYVVNTLPSTPATRGMLNRQSLASCSADHGTVFVNVGRGDVATEKDLVWALDNEHLAHAVLDVFAVEPLPADSSLWEREDVTVTPHVSAISVAPAVAELFLHNLRLFAEDKPLRFRVEFLRGY